MRQNQLNLMKELDLDVKIKIAENKIKEWYNHFNGNVFVAFSGGKDSTVLLHLIRKLYPNCKAVFCDTGLEFPEIKKFIKTINNVEWIKPKKTFKEILDKYGFPVISKKVAMGISRYRNTKSCLQKHLRLNGGINPSSGKKQERSIPIKYHYLVEAPFKISEQCCTYMKKQPFHKYQKNSKLNPYIGTMAFDSDVRRVDYIKHRCNAFDKKFPQSRPLSLWTEKNIWEYIKRFNVDYSKIYDMGYDRTGCVYCCFGVQMEKGRNRFQKMKTTHPKLYNYCINKLGIGDVLDFMKVNY